MDEQKPARYFVYDPEDGYNEFKTDEERQKAHQEAIDGYLSVYPTDVVYDTCRLHVQASRLTSVDR